LNVGALEVIAIVPDLAEPPVGYARIFTLNVPFPVFGPPPVITIQPL